MDSSQIVLIVGVLVLTAINFVTLAWVGRLHRKLESRPVPKQYNVHVDGSKLFAEIDSDEVKSMVHDKLVTSTAKAAAQFEDALTKVIPKLVADIDEVNTQAMKKEFEKFQANIQALSAEAMQDQFRLQQDVTNRRAELMEALDQEVVKQYQIRMGQFDARMGDVVSSYIVESLGKQADLGAQMPYILDQLEQHKKEIKEDMLA